MLGRIFTPRVDQLIVIKKKCQQLRKKLHRQIQVPVGCQAVVDRMYCGGQVFTREICLYFPQRKKFLKALFLTWKHFGKAFMQVQEAIGESTHY